MQVHVHRKFNFKNTAQNLLTVRKMAEMKYKIIARI